MNTTLIAPCGMNCGICMAYLRDKNHCVGCWGDDATKMKSCLACIIRNCEKLTQLPSKFCYDCEQYPCKRLKQLDKRYRTKYEMSMLENLEFIKRNGADAFVQKEAERWKCPHCEGTICVHRKICWTCKKSPLTD